jgi:hypothetical protein
MSQMTTRIAATAHWLAQRDLAVLIAVLTLLALVIIGVALTILPADSADPVMATPIRWSARLH